MLKRLHWKERRWFNWLEFVMFVKKNRWQGAKSPEPAGKLVSVQSIDNYQTYSGSAFKRKAGISGYVYVRDASGPGKS